MTISVGSETPAAPRLVIICATAIALSSSFVPLGAEPPDPALRELQRSIIDAVEHVESAVVSVARRRRGVQRRTRNATDDPRSGSTRNAIIPADSGSGILIRTSNPDHRIAILTCLHIVRGGPIHGVSDHPDTTSDLSVRISNQPPVSVSIFAGDPLSDLAVLVPDDRFDDSGPAARYAIDLSPVTAEFRKGSFVITVSNPFLSNHNAAPTAGWGIVANRNRSRPGSYNGSETDHRGLLADLRTMLQLSAHPPVRESGSVVFDLDGRALGITTSVFPPGSNEASAVYALPFTHGIMRIVRELTLGLEVEYGSLGTTATQAPLPEELRLRASHPYSTAARVISVQPGSAANLGDLTAGDDVLSVAGIPIRDHVDLLREVLLHGPWDGTPSGERLILRTVRNPKLVERTVRLNKRPSVSGGGIVATRDRYPVWRGIRVDYPTARREYLPTDGVRAIPLGVLVVSVDDDSSHSLKQGDLIRAVAGRPVGTPGQFHGAVRQQPDQPVQLELTDSRIAIVDPQAD